MLANTLEIIGHNPAIGVGTGGFGKAYADRVGGTGAPATENPHNEILLMVVQFGIAGFALFAALLVAQWRIAARLPTRFDRRPPAHSSSRHRDEPVLVDVARSCRRSLLLAYMGGLLFAGYRAEMPAVGRQRAS